MPRKRRRLTRSQRREKRKRTIYILPNLITSLSLLSGFYAIISSIEGHFTNASLAILFSLVLDGLDGKIARATKSTSRFGVEYDSLCDLVSFGVAPAILMFTWALKPLGRIGWLASFLFVACGALRLARFNIQTNTASTYFIGLPIPAAASMTATMILLMEEIDPSTPIIHWSPIIMFFLLSFLMVSNIHYLSFKELELGHLKSFNWLVAILLFFILVAIQPQVIGFLLLSLYIFGSPLAAWHITYKKTSIEPAHTLDQEITSA